MSLVDDVMDRVRDQVTDLHGAVDDAIALSEITEKGRAPQRTTAFVILVAEDAEPNAVVNFLRQRVVSTVGVILGVVGTGDHRGAAARDRIDPLKEAAKTALVGWQPAAAASPLEYRGYGFAASRPGLVLVQLNFTTDSYLRVET